MLACSPLSKLSQSNTIEWVLFEMLLGYDFTYCAISIRFIIFYFFLSFILSLSLYLFHTIVYSIVYYFVRRVWTFSLVKHIRGIESLANRFFSYFAVELDGFFILTLSLYLSLFASLFRSAILNVYEIPQCCTKRGTENLDFFFQTKKVRKKRWFKAILAIFYYIFFYILTKNIVDFIGIKWLVWPAEWL